MTTLYLLGSAALPVLDVAPVIEEAQGAGYDVCLGLTPAAARWLEPQLPELERLTGHPVRSEYKQPGAADAWPRADVALFVPATFNSINAWALGLTSSFVVGFAAEAIGKGIPLITMPCVNAAYAQHRALDRSVAELRAMGVRVLYGDGGFVPNPSGERHPYPWDLALGAVRETVPPRA
ncbi:MULTISPECIES: flavoprotein [unclassified Streptomyces]|uniref:flavoprotein n=1 Tax=unclassified Streptomyces TaxID=2593676 RepID=UPI0001B568B1|nr:MULTISPECIES: flavoprotein [unclassified Streptomyces]EFK98448.1 flavoprotein [Streptomyces sp. SPB78]MYR27299.1 flavoprotein [Streptomyces sp. SID4945]SCD61769.1 Flavoprotein [Streptomyces sp. TverLS-915]SCF21431.1 Flavoprotein [Streptomyces sp. LcepLS]